MTADGATTQEVDAVVATDTPVPPASTPDVEPPATDVWVAEGGPDTDND